MTTRQDCSQYDTSETMAGTCDTVDVWIMLEYKSAWRAKVNIDNELDVETRQWLEDAVALCAKNNWKARVQFIRQGNYERDNIHLFIASKNQLLRFSGDDYKFLQGLNPVDAINKPQKATLELDPIYFVCTNGQRDECCSRYGRPVYAALRCQVSQRCWQVTHLGGHRFAPNILVLPQCAMYGRVSPTKVVEFSAAIDQGQLYAEGLRGRSFFSKEVQAAEVFALEYSGLAGELNHCHTTESDGVWTVRFQCLETKQVFDICISKHADKFEILASCGDHQMKPTQPFLYLSAQHHGEFDASADSLSGGLL